MHRSPSISPAESEFYGLSTGVCETLHVRQLMEELGHVFMAATEFRNYLYTITNDAPKFTINTANGAVPVEAVGVALAYLRVGDSWECYEIPNVLVLYT